MTTCFKATCDAMRRLRLPLIGCLVALTTLAASPARASSIIAIGGAGDTGLTIATGEAGAISFVLTQAFTNVTIDAPLVCISTAPCVGGLWVQQTSIGAGASFADSLFAQPYPVGTTPLVSGLSLGSGTYFLILSMSQGTAAWLGSLSPTQSIAAGASLGLEFTSSSLQPFVPQSTFSVSFAAGSLHYTVTGDSSTTPPTPVPEPGTLLLVGLGGLALIRRVRR